mmetsp:Transcript_8511/g.14333  ORF Transcript_8511/g.14333 Transcript_8511/m.14333 type:complete len:194 (+) Transcript_8511:1680-2261(+)
MDHPMFLFGLKQHNMQNEVEFFDADFCNTLIIKSELFKNYTLKKSCSVINQILVKNGFMGKLLEVGKLKDIAHFNLGKVIINKDFIIQLRFQNFMEANSAYYALKKESVQTMPDQPVLSGEEAAPQGQMDNLQVIFQNPEIQYYDGKFSTQFENCIRDKFEGLEKVNEVPSNYVSSSLKDYGLSSIKGNLIQF